MLAEKFFAVAQLGHEATLWILIALSIFSVACIIERWFAIAPMQKKSESIAKLFSDTLQSNSLKDVEDIAKDRESLEGRALAYGLRHTKEHGTKGLEEIFSSFALLERPKLEKRLNFLATVGANA